MSQMSPSQMRVIFEMNLAREAKERRDTARVRQEYASMTDLLVVAKVNRVKKLFIAIHATLSPYFSKVAPFKGALTFYVGTHRKSALRVFPDGGGHAGSVRFEVDLAELTAGISLIHPVETADVIRSLPTLSAGSSPRWRSGIFKTSNSADESNCVDDLAALFGDAEQNAYHAAIKEVGDMDEIDPAFREFPGFG